MYIAKMDEKYQEYYKRKDDEKENRPIRKLISFDV